MAKKLKKRRTTARRRARADRFHHLKTHLKPLRKRWKQAREWADDHRAAVGSVFGAFLVLSAAWLLWPIRDISAENKEIPTQVTADPTQQDPWDFFHPVWRDDDTWQLFPTSAEERNGLRDYLGILRDTVKDPKKKLEAEFQVPEFMRDRVVFWMLVHSRYTRRIRVVHDRNNPGMVYGYLDFRPLYRYLGMTGALDRHISRVEKAVIQGIRDRFLEVTGAQPVALVTPREREQLHAFLSRHGGLGKARAVELAGSIRTQTGQADEFIAALNRSRHLLPHIESVLRQAGLPVALGRIPFVESSFNDIAHSKVGAMGIWQFMPATAAQMIGRNNRHLWADPIRQTKAAARLLRMYRSILPDWSTTVTAYNSGVGRLRRLVQKYRARDLEAILQIHGPDSLGFAGENFYAQFLSANLVEAYKDELFGSTLSPNEVAKVLKGMKPFPEEVCDVAEEQGRRETSTR